MDAEPQASHLASERWSLAPGQLTRLLAELAEAPAADVEPSSPPRAGDRLGRFLLVREIGRGGFGVVFEAEDTELRRRVALKVVLPGRNRREPEEWMHREAEAAAQLRHPHIVTLHDAGVSDGRTFLVYELLHGTTLDAWNDGQRPSRREAARILREIAGALAHVHAAGVVHRDLKAANVFVEASGGVKLLDLGLAQMAGAFGQGAGSPPYAPPEQWRGGRIDARADVHAWGVLGYLLLTGELPGPGSAPLRASKGSLEELVDAARSSDPERRPTDGAALAAALGALDRRAVRQRTFTLATLALALVLAAAGGGAKLLRAKPALPPGPFRIAVADAVNGTGDEALDGLGDLVSRGLDAPPRLRVLDRTRLGGVLRASRRATPARLDPATTAFAARQAGAAAVVVPTASSVGAGFQLALEVREPETDRLLVSVRELAASKAAVVAAVDRLVRRTREALQDREHDVRAVDRELARTVSSSLEAHQRYFAGRRCIDRPSEGASWVRLDCAQHFHEALAIDPDFPLAHFELAWLARWDAHSTASLASILDPALQRLDRLPARNQAQLRAWKSELDGDLDRAAEILRAAADEFPEDAHVALALGELFYRQGRHADAVAPLERAVALDPGLELASAELVWSLILLGREDALRAVADRMAASAPSPGTLHAEVAARAATGDLDAALRVARRAAIGGGGAASEDLEDALVAAGAWDEAEALLRQKANAGDGRAARRLGTLLFMRGRFREAIPLAETPPPHADEPRMRFVAGAWRAHRLAASRDARRIRQFVEETRAWSPEIAATLAPTVAYVGDVELAKELLPGLEPGSGDSALTSALVAWREGHARAALPVLRRVARADPAASEGLPAEAPLWIAAECAAEVEPGEGALEDIRRFQRFYPALGMWSAWALPRSFVLEARQLILLGRTAEALEALGRLDALWARADRGLPLLAEARALRASVARPGAAAAQASDPRRP